MTLWEYQLSLPDSMEQAYKTLGSRQTVFYWKEGKISIGGPHWIHFEGHNVHISS